MRRARWRTDDPAVFVNGQEYVVDIEKSEFRCSVYPFRRVGFESVEGLAFWDELMILTCRACGLITVEPRHIEDIECEGCGRALC